MIKSHRIFFTICFAALLPSSALAEVPVVDNSENYALLEQQTQLEQPIERPETDLAFNDTLPLDENEPELGTPLAEETTAPDSNPPSPEEEKPLAYDGDSQDKYNEQDNALLLARVQTLQQEVQELRGQLEVQAHDLKLLQQQQLAFYKDLDARLNNASSSTTEQATMTSAPTKPENKTQAHIQLESLNSSEKTNPANEQISYLKAYELVKNKQYDQALKSMQTFIYQYPQSGYTANAQYWLGELYLVKKQYPDAIEHFDVVLKKYPTSSKAAASMLKIGYALAATGKKEDARQYLQQVVKNYPDTKTAQLATAKLQALGS